MVLINHSCFSLASSFIFPSSFGIYFFSSDPSKNSVPSLLPNNISPIKFCFLYSSLFEFFNFGSRMLFILLPNTKFATNVLPASSRSTSFGRFFFILLLYSRLYKKISAADLDLARVWRRIINPIKKKCSIKNKRAINVVSYFFVGGLKASSIGGWASEGGGTGSGS